MTSPLLASAMVLADAGPTGGLLGWFLVFVAVLFAVFIGLVVLAIFGIRRWRRKRRS